MTSEEYTGHLDDAMRCLGQVLEHSDDPAERTTALFACYARLAILHASQFWDLLRVDPYVMSEFGHGTLSERAHAAVGEQIKMLIGQNHSLGIVGDEPDRFTTQLVGETFFARLNELMQSVPPAGHT